MDMHRQLVGGKGMRLLAASFTLGVTIAHMNGHSIPQIGQRESGLSVTPIRCAQQ